MQANFQSYRALRAREGDKRQQMKNTLLIALFALPLVSAVAAAALEAEQNAGVRKLKEVAHAIIDKRVGEDDREV